MALWHLTLATDGRNPAFPDEDARRAAVHAVGRVLGPRLVMFALVDDHGHFVVFADAAEVGQVGRSIRLALRALGADFQAADVRAVADRGHMENLVNYLLTQPQHHKLPVHPATWTGSCFADVVGARTVPGIKLRLADALPRFPLLDMMPSVLLPRAAIVRATPDVLRAVGTTRIVSAAAAAFAAPVALRGRAPEANRARRAGASLAQNAGFGSADIARALGITVRAAARLSGAPVEDVDVVRARLGLEELAAIPRVEPVNKQGRKGK